MTSMLSPVVVGRDGQLASLRAGLESAAGGRGTTVVVAGEPGVGKTRLLREVRDWSIERGVPALLGRGVQTATPIAFRPLGEALLAADRAGFRWDDPDVAPFRGALAHLVPSLYADAGVAAAASMPSLLHVAEGFLRVARVHGRGRGAVVLLDDAHWADPETLAVVEYLADHVPEEPVLVVLSARLDHSLDAVTNLLALVDRRSAMLLRLSRLTAEQTNDMTQGCLGNAAVSPAVLRLVQDRADGLPFFVEELLAGLANDGILVLHDGGWEVRGDHRRGVPETVTESVRRRSASLAEPTRQVLLDAALLGRRIDAELMGEVLGLEVPTIDAVLSQAAQLTLVEFREGGARFRHALTRDALLAGMRGPDRSSRARRMFAALRAARPTPPDELLEATADLAEIAGETDAATELLLEVGRRALRRGALSSAEAALRRALALAGGAPLEVLVMRELVVALAVAGRADEAFPLGEVLLGRLEKDGADPDGSARRHVHLALARTAVAATDWSLATAHLDNAESDEADPGSAAQVDSLRALVAIGEYRVDDAAALAAAAVDAAAKVGDADLHCEALLVHGRCLRTRDMDAAVRILGRARKVAQEAGLVHREARALTELGFAQGYQCGDPARLQEARRLAIACGAPETEAVAEQALAALGWWRDDPTSVLTHAAAAIRLAKRYRLGQLVPAALIMAASGHALRADRTGMEAFLAEALPLCRDEPTELVAVHAHCLAACALAEGDLGIAATELRVAADLALRAQLTAVPPLVALEPLARMASSEGEEDGAERIAVFRNRHLDLGVQMPALLEAAGAVHLGRAADPSAAATVERARRSLAANGFMHAVVGWLVAPFAAEDGWGEPVVWLADALEAFESRGLRGPADACRATLRRLGRRVPRGAGEFSPRELDVLALVVEGLPNREIAGKLYLSARTVEKHVERLLAKTGTANRAQLAAYALRRLPQDTLP